MPEQQADFSPDKAKFRSNNLFIARKFNAGRWEIRLLMRRL